MKTFSPRHLLRAWAMTLPAVAGLCLASPASAEKWSDTTGNFEIEAEYVRVDGRSVVLRKTDGSSISVPINRLSEKSRTRAKQLFDLSRTSRSGTTTNSQALPTDYQPDNDFANIVAPTPPDIGRMDAFPQNPSLQQQFDYVKTQVMSGHLEVFWYCLPNDLRTQLDSPEVRDVFRPTIQTYAEQNEPMEKITLKLLEVLTTKKDYVLGSSMLATLPPGAKPMLQQGYDPAVGLMYEWMSLSNGLTSIPDTTLTQLVNYHLPRLGAHAKELLPILPPGMLDNQLNQIVVDQTSATEGTITVPKQDGGTETLSMTLHQERWLPSAFVETLIANQDNLLQQAKDSVDEFEEVISPANQAQTTEMLNNISGPINTTLDSLLAASSQQEFDQTLMGMMQQAMTIFAGMGDPNLMPAAQPTGF
ncbi:SHD1 domain-containing protein [Rhodopirellula sp. SWK7]|uniref:SHD1 domain-containing protein n=1 Tax=Rhodopirellula sp. SWK7 TaxID=595460 RepID=UPI001F3192C9|nr:SHD1 domain-containing protein [Rhodopirellula sp. SWK7]